MNTTIEDWPMNRDFEDLTSAEQKQVRDAMGEETYRAHRELHRHFTGLATTPVEPLKATKEKLDTAFKARYTTQTAQSSGIWPQIFRWRTLQVVAASLVLLTMGYSLSFVISPFRKPSPAVREVIRYVDRPVREVEYRTVYVDRPVKVYEKLPISDPTAVDTTDNLALNENQGVSMAGDTVLQALMVTLN